MVNKPEFIQKQALADQLKRRAKDATEIDDDLKRQKRAGSVEPLDVVPAAPELSQEMKERQVCKSFLLHLYI